MSSYCLRSLIAIVIASFPFLIQKSDCYNITKLLAKVNLNLNLNIENLNQGNLKLNLENLRGFEVFAPRKPLGGYPPENFFGENYFFIGLWGRGWVSGVDTSIQIR